MRKAVRKKVITVTDPMQKGYRYALSESEGKNFHPEFKPDLTPKQMLALGVFDGNYFEGETHEYPMHWFPKKTTSLTSNPKLNQFRVHASQTREVWIQKGWMHPDDPRGWFQWYCRYYLGRRHPDDSRQIKRWKAFRRHAGQVIRYCMRGDLTCRTVQRQALLHWAYDSRKF